MIENTALGGNILIYFGANEMTCKFTVLSWCVQTEALPLVFTLLLLAVVLLTGVTVAFGWKELVTLLSLLLEIGVSVLGANERVLTDELKYVCNVLLVTTGVIVEVSDAPVVNLDTVDVFWMCTLLGVTVNPVVEVGDVWISEVVLLIPKLELLGTNEELVTRTLELGEAPPLVPSGVVVLCKLTLDKIVLDLSTLVRVCEVTKLEFNAEELRARLTVTLEDDITVWLALPLSVKTVVELATLEGGSSLVVFDTLLSTSVTELDMEPLVSVAFNTLLVFGNKTVEEAKAGLLVDEIAVDNEEIFGSIVLDVGIKLVELTLTAVVEIVVTEGSRLVLEEETDEFASRVTALDKVPCVVEKRVEFTPTLELLGRLADNVTEDVFVTFETVKPGLDGELLVTRKVLDDDETVLKVMFTLDMSTSEEVDEIAVRLVARVLGNVRLSVVPVVGDNAEVVIVTNEDLSIIDVEFTRAVLWAVEGKCEIES